MVIYSVIIPHYADEERLERLLRSIPVARQDIEVIVIDDCSPDQSVLDSVRLRWPRVVWLTTLVNAGAGAARNVGLDVAQGVWVVFADSDDEFLTTAFDTFDLFLRKADQVVYFMADAVQELDGSSSVRSQRLNELVVRYAQSPSYENLMQLRLQHVVPWAKVYSRSFIKKIDVRFDPVRRANDISFNVLAAVQASVLRAELVSVYRVYRRHGSLTGDVSESAFLSRFLVNRSLAQRLAALGLSGSRDATGEMLMSFRYGPRVALKVFWLAIRSPMRIEWCRMFELKRWRKFFDLHRLSQRESKRNKN